MKLFSKQITDPDQDSVFICAVALVCLVIALIPPYGYRAFIFGLGAGVNFCHRSLENQPVGVDSKPATLRRGVHSILVSPIKRFRLRDRTSRGRAFEP
jgi:hypothetical protein